MKGESTLLEELDALFQQMIDQQRRKVLAVARSIDARLTADDVLSSDDFPELARSARFNYEDGQLAGLLSAHAAVRAHHRQRPI